MTDAGHPRPACHSAPTRAPCLPFVFHLPMSTRVRAVCAFAAVLVAAASPAAAQSPSAVPAASTSRADVSLVVTDAATREPLAGVTVAVVGTRSGATTDGDGRATLTTLATGRVRMRLTSVGYAPLDTTVVLPLAAPLALALTPDEDELDELVVSTTRTSRSLADSPTRIEAIGAEEIGEKITMDPSGIAMVLSESPGITVQQTSAVSANASFRIQGLDGRYTQLLRDGLPLYGGFAGGLSLLQIPPLDLARVEVVKGPAGALYGGDAIAGLINLVTKTPDDAEDGRERSLLLNATSAAGADAALYLAGRGAGPGAGPGTAWGGTLLATANVQRAYDPEDDGFSNLPATQRATFAPTLYRYTRRGTLRASLTATAERRDGGALAALRDDDHDDDAYDESLAYAERNRTARLSGAVAYSGAHGLWQLGARSSASVFRREVTTPASRFSGDQRASYSDLTAARTVGAHTVVGGVDLRTDAFDGHGGAGNAAAALDYRHATLGVFAQDTWDVAPALAVDAGLRVDAHSAFGAFVLPRLSALVRMGRGVTVRAGGGLGYKAPTVFLEASEERAFDGVTPLSADVDAETSIGGTFDVGWRGLIGSSVGAEVHQAVYATRLRRPLLPVDRDAAALVYRNADGALDARGSETTLRLSTEMPVGGLSLFLGYVFLDAALDTVGTRSALALTARHRTYSVLVWEREDHFRIGAEAYYTGPQTRRDGTGTPGYWLTGLLGEVVVRGGVRVFVNLENLLDTRQSRTEALVTGPITAPRFADLWGPTDGFIANGGVRLSF